MDYFSRLRLYAVLIFALSGSSCCVYGQEIQPQNNIDSLRRALKNYPPDDQTIAIAFGIADNFMELDQYDSAQLWLNKIAGLVPLKKPTLANYLLSTRQAEIFYYNGLQRLGLQEAERLLQTATVLNDSLLLADSYNFLGLFYMNLDSNQKSITYFREGIRYSRQPPYPSRYLSLSKPHHLVGNMAEAFVKTVQYDSALTLARESLQMAQGISSGRGMGVASNLMGMIFLRQRLTDSAVHYYNAAINITQQSLDPDVELISYGGLALSYATLEKKAAAFTALQSGFTLLKKETLINNLFYSQFLDDAVAIYKKYGDERMLISTLDQKATLALLRNKKNDLQMNTLLDEGLKNETRLLSFEVKEAQQQQKLANIRLMLALATIVLLAIGLLVYRYTQKQKMGVANIRQKISQDLHDDIGASLSSLQIYGAIAEQTMEKDPEKSMEMIRKISSQSRTVMENMGDIVWSMKSNDTNNTTLGARIKNYGAELLNDKNIAFTYDIQPQIENVLQSIHARRNIVLIIKEAMNNIAKYSRAQNAALSVNTNGNNIVLKITDDGVGFDDSDQKAGNGLKNMQQRTKELNGSLILNTAPGKGTAIIAIFPLTAVNDTGW